MGGHAARLNQAAALLDQFQEAPDEAVRKGALQLATVYRLLSKRVLAGGSTLEKFAKAKTVDDIASLTSEAARRTAQIQEAWRLLPLGVASVMDALIDSERLSDGRVLYLRLTCKERAELETVMKELFPDIRPHQKDGQIVDVSVNLFREWLERRLELRGREVSGRGTTLLAEQPQVFRQRRVRARLPGRRGAPASAPCRPRGSSRA